MNYVRVRSRNGKNHTINVTAVIQVVEEHGKLPFVKLMGKNGFFVDGEDWERVLEPALRGGQAKP